MTSSKHRIYKNSTDKLRDYLALFFGIVLLSGCNTHEKPEQYTAGECLDQQKLWGVSATSTDKTTTQITFECSENEPQLDRIYELLDIGAEVNYDLNNVVIQPLTVSLLSEQDLERVTFIADSDRDPTLAFDVDSVRPGPWGKVDLSDDVSIDVYEGTRNEAHRLAGNINKMRFFFSPPLTIDRKKVTVNNYPSTSIVSFPVEMTNPGLKETVKKLIEELEGVQLNSTQIMRLPINTIDVGVELPPQYRDIRYFYPKGVNVTNSRPNFNRVWRPDFEFLEAEKAEKFAEDIRQGKVKFLNNIYFSGSTSDQNILTITITGEQKTKIQNILKGSGGRTYATRHQLSEAVKEVLKSVRVYNHLEDADKSSVENDAIKNLLEDKSFIEQAIDFDKIDQNLLNQISRYQFDQADLKPEVVRKTLLDIKNSENIETAKSLKIGARAEASFLGFKGGASGTYESESSFKSRKENAFEYGWEGERYVPKKLKIFTLTETNISSNITLSITNSVVRKGEGHLIVERRSADDLITEKPPEVSTPRRPRRSEEIQLSKIIFIDRDGARKQINITQKHPGQLGLEVLLQFNSDCKGYELEIYDSNGNLAWEWDGVSTEVWSSFIEGKKASITARSTLQGAGPCYAVVDKLRIHTN